MFPATGPVGQRPAYSLQDPAVTWLEWLLERGERNSRSYDFMEASPGLDEVVVPDLCCTRGCMPCLVLLAGYCVRSQER